MTRGMTFTETREQARIKAELVASYLWAWGKARLAVARKPDACVGYFDVYAGPGRADEASRTAPLTVLARAADDAEMRDALICVCNDADEDGSDALRKAIRGLKGVRKLRHPPIVARRDSGLELVGLSGQYRHTPAFFFIDPFGYKGLSLQLPNHVLRDWGCDCAVYLSYGLINLGLGNPDVREHINALFGRKRADALRARLESLDPDAREAAIVEQVGQVLRQMGGKFVLPFRFKNEDGTRTNHHLIFATAHFPRYETMKKVMAEYSSSATQGVPSFEYSPDVERQPTLFEVARPLDALHDALPARFAGRRLALHDIYEQHCVGTPYLKRHYKAALACLEAEGKVSAEPPAAKRRKVKGEIAFGDDVVVKFPRKK
ncbi:MAG: three-Cys-motif partner protein TcmP [Anaerolineae bacterium]|nr:three-Cys-motif partner protein TcmP [Anaerolineae bacterium]